MLSFFKQLAERTDNSSSSTFLSKFLLNGNSCASSFSSACFGSSKFINNWSWSCSILSTYYCGGSRSNNSRCREFKGKFWTAAYVTTRRKLQNSITRRNHSWFSILMDAFNKTVTILFNHKSVSLQHLCFHINIKDYIKFCDEIGIQIQD